MNKSHKVKTTRVRQAGSAASKPRAGIPHKGTNLVPQKAASTKKANARRKASASKTAKR